MGDMLKKNNAIKKTILMGILSILTFLVLSDEARAGERTPLLKRVSFRLSGGYSYMSLGDLNTYVSSWNYYYEKYAVSRGGSVPEKYEYLHDGYNLEGEILINLSSRWAASFSLGHIDMENNTTLIYRAAANDETKHFLTHVVKVTPLTVGVYYSFPLLRKIKFFLHTGVGYYFAKLSQDYDFQRFDDYWAKWQKDMSSSDFGFQGGIGFEWDIKKYLSLVLGVYGQHAKIKPFEGTRKYENSLGYQSEQEGVFYCWEEYDPEVGISSLLILPEKPEPAWNIKDIREFILDLKGISLRLGIKIKLF
ncbi:MAG: outer membrane beta-barrel protein [Nitrospirota bacterium]|nr:outer membrane beta-barrel protein [Nitrospirota bacterium]